MSCNMAQCSGKLTHSLTQQKTWLILRLAKERTLTNDHARNLFQQSKAQLLNTWSCLRHSRWSMDLRVTLLSRSWRARTRTCAANQTLRSQSATSLRESVILWCHSSHEARRIWSGKVLAKWTTVVLDVLQQRHVMLPSALSLPWMLMPVLRWYHVIMLLCNTVTHIELVIYIIMLRRNVECSVLSQVNVPSSLSDEWLHEWVSDLQCVMTWQQVVDNLLLDQSTWWYCPALVTNPGL